MSREKFFSRGQKLWRPLAAVVLSVSSSAIVENPISKPAPIIRSIERQFTPRYVLDLYQGPKRAEKYEIAPIEDIALLPSLPAQYDQPTGPVPPTAEENATALVRQQAEAERVRQLAANPAPTVRPQPMPRQAAPAPSGGGSQVGLITGYYCEYVPGYPRGDGGGFCGTTRSGAPVAEGTAACGSNWPIGTTLRIEGYGTVVCTDTGNLSNNQVDIFFRTNERLHNAGIPFQSNVSIVK